MTETDYGERCDEHVGEVFPPRCTDCEARSARRSRPRRPKRTTVVRPAPAAPSPRDCPLHDGYPSPCPKCERDADPQLL